jgi:predicted transcriptional regulator
LTMELTLSELLGVSIHKLMISANDVACVQEDNSAEHALLVLVKAGYSAIPVLNRKSRVTGVISKTMILDSILGLERIEFDKLFSITVQNVMKQDIRRVTLTTSFLHVLELCIGAPFICVDDDDGSFLGLITRQAVLSQIHKYLRPRHGKSSHPAH